MPGLLCSGQSLRNHSAFSSWVISHVCSYEGVGRLGLQKGAGWLPPFPDQNVVIASDGWEKKDVPRKMEQALRRRIELYQAPEPLWQPTGTGRASAWGGDETGLPRYR